GIDGSVEMSGAVATLMVANRLSSNPRLAELAIVGAVGDLQDSRFGKLVGFNRRLVEFLNGDIVEIQRDIRFFGKQTRPIAKMLEYNTDPIIPGITGDENGSLKFLASVGVDLLS
ncbi:MAG: recombinase RecJ, partial [Archaeoglobaceae archaeon]